MNEFRQVASMELLHPDGTPAFLFDQPASNCGGGDDDWDLAFRDGAANSWPPAGGQCGDGGQSVGEGLEFTPAEALLGVGGAFTGKSAVGDWTLRITNSVGVTDDMTLQEWGLYVCVDPN